MRKMYVSKIFHLFIMMIFTIISCSLDTTPKKLSNESKITVKPDLFSSSQVKLDKFRNVSFKSESIKKSNKPFSTKATGSLFSGGTISTMPEPSDIVIDIDANEDETWSLDFSTFDPNCGFQIVSSPHSGVGATRLTLSVGGPWPDGVYTIALNGSPIGAFSIKNEQSVTIEKISEDDTALKVSITPLTEDPYTYEIAGFGTKTCNTFILTSLSVSKSLFPAGTYTLKAYMMKYPDISSSISFTVNPTSTPTPTSSSSVSPTPTSTPTSSASPSSTPTPTSSPTVSPTPTSTPTPTTTPTVNPTPSVNPTSTPTPTSSPSVSPTPTSTPTPSPSVCSSNSNSCSFGTKSINENLSKIQNNLNYIEENLKKSGINLNNNNFKIKTVVMPPPIDLRLGLYQSLYEKNINDINTTFENILAQESNLKSLYNDYNKTLDFLVKIDPKKEPQRYQNLLTIKSNLEDQISLSEIQFDSTSNNLDSLFTSLTNIETNIDSLLNDLAVQSCGCYTVEELNKYRNDLEQYKDNNLKMSKDTGKGSKFGEHYPDRVAKEMGLTKEQRKKLGREIEDEKKALGKKSNENLDLETIRELAKEILGL